MIVVMEIKLKIYNGCLLLKTYLIAGHLKIMTDQTLKSDLSIAYSQIPECREEKRGVLVRTG